MIYPLSNSRLVLVCWTAGIKSERDTGDRVSFNDFFKHRERAIVLAGQKKLLRRQQRQFYVVSFSWLILDDRDGKEVVLVLRLIHFILSGIFLVSLKWDLRFPSSYARKAATNPPAFRVTISQRIIMSTGSFQFPPEGTGLLLVESRDSASIFGEHQLTF